MKQIISLLDERFTFYIYILLKLKGGQFLIAYSKC